MSPAPALDDVFGRVSETERRSHTCLYFGSRACASVPALPSDVPFDLWPRSQVGEGRGQALTNEMAQFFWPGRRTFHNNLLSSFPPPSLSPAPPPSFLTPYLLPLSFLSSSCSPPPPTSLPPCPDLKFSPRREQKALRLRQRGREVRRAGWRGGEEGRRRRSRGGAGKKKIGLGEDGSPARLKRRRVCLGSLSVMSRMRNVALWVFSFFPSFFLSSVTNSVLQKSEYHNHIFDRI